MKSTLNALSPSARRRPFLRFAFCALILVGYSASSRAGSLFWSISGDPNNFYVPDLLSSVDLTAQTVNNVAALGGGSLAFNGGLTVGPGGTLYGIANDSGMNSSFYSIAPNGVLTLIGSAGGLGQGFMGGLTYDTQNATFYAAVQDPLGNTTLYSISPAGQSTNLGMSLGTGFSGLAFDSANGLFYGITNDSFTFSNLVDFSLGGPVNFVGSLGFGDGALTYDSANNVFWDIAPVNNAGSTLFEITPYAEVFREFTLGDGFAELAVQPATVPEPTGAAEVGAGLCLLALLLGRIRFK